MAMLRIVDSAAVEEGKLRLIDHAGVGILLARVEGAVYAVENKCSHLGFSMAKGQLDGNELVCPFHRSRFDICTGKNLDWVQGIAGVSAPLWARKLIAVGKAPAPVRSFPCEEREDGIYIDTEELN